MASVDHGRTPVLLRWIQQHRQEAVAVFCAIRIADELQQLASYFEFPQSGECFINAGDAIGCQYQALNAYAAILEHRGDEDAAEA